MTIAGEHNHRRFILAQSCESRVFAIVFAQNFPRLVGLVLAQSEQPIRVVPVVPILACHCAAMAIHDPRGCEVVTMPYDTSLAGTRIDSPQASTGSRSRHNHR